MKNLLHYKPYTFKEKDEIEIVSIGNSSAEIKLYDVLFEDVLLFEYKGEKQVEKMVNMLNGAFLLGVSQRLVSDSKNLVNYVPYYHETFSKSSPLAFLGVLGGTGWKILFDGELVINKYTKKQADDMVNMLNGAFSFGVLKQENLN